MAEVNGLKAEVKELKGHFATYIQRAESVQISKLRIDMLKRDGFVCESVWLDSIVDDDNGKSGALPAFEWPNPDEEADITNKEAYLDYFKVWIFILYRELQRIIEN
jgi:uncharacterized protein YegJ (DUF2314 family)